MDLASLVTEQRRDDLSDLDLRSTLDLVQLMVADHAEAIAAVAREAPRIARAVDVIATQLERGGRLVYVGAGTAGRLGLLDAAECPPTFDTDRVVGVLAGGQHAILSPQEGVEDDAACGAADVAALSIGAADVVVGVAASGRTPYTIGALDEARRCGAVTIGVSCNPGAELSRHADHAIEAVVGPEMLAGSTRLKAGTAQKVVLNALSTLAMVRTGKTFGGLMVDVRATNGKLRDRARRIVSSATGAAEPDVDAAVAAAGGEVKVAIVMLAAGTDAETARRMLVLSGGAVRQALEASA
jgi:N-acetylmuramic acid 6-phosphate etherase